MSMIANLQYGWTLFVNPISAKHGWARAGDPGRVHAVRADRDVARPDRGLPRRPVRPAHRRRARVVARRGGVGDELVRDARCRCSTSRRSIGGIGAGAVYGTCVGNALKWFPDRRGLAAGLTSMGFGAGSALTIVPISSTIKSHGYEYAFLVFGIGQGVTVFLARLVPASNRRAEFARVASRGRRDARAVVLDRSPMEMARTPAFWVMYVMFVLMAAGGLMATAQLAPIANDFKVADVPVSILGLTLPALTFALSIDRVLNGVTRPVCGWISDRIGRENTMFLAFALEGCGILLLGQHGRRAR